MSTGTEKFLEIRELFTRLRNDICKVTEAYWIWHNLIFAKSIAESGEEIANKNVKILNSATYFFTAVEDSLLHTFIIGLSKFFDKDHRALSIPNLIKKIKQEKDWITGEVIVEFLPVHSDRQETINNYTPLKDEDIKYIENLINKHSVLISKLKEIRDKQSAHNDIELTQGTFIPNEIQALIISIQHVFNRLSVTFYSSSTIWDTWQKEAASDVRYILENLERGEKQRRTEFENK